VATTTVEALPVRDEARPVVAKHHALVRVTHWLNIPLLLGLTLSGLSIYWASPVLHHAPIVKDGPTDYFASLGVWVTQHLPILAHGYGGGQTDRAPEFWFYDHFSLGPQGLASALNLHWLFAYLFMANGLLYLIGLGLGGGYKALLPRRTDFKDAVKMQVYYVGLPFAKLLKRPSRPSTTPCSAARTSPCPSSGRWPCSRAGRSTSRSSSAGCRPCSAATTGRACGTSG